MIPIRDGIPTRQAPVVNYLLIAANILIFLFMTLLPEDALNGFIDRYAMVPANFTDGITLADISTIFTSMFMHAGLAHIGGNMIYLWIFGDNVEDRLGRGWYIVFYLTGGVVASLAHLTTNWGSDLPTVGASGAIAAVLGAYLVLFPASRIVTIIPLRFFSRLTVVPAIVVLGLWFILQLFDGVMALGGAYVGGVAVWAHIGGFIYGLLIARILTSTSRVERFVTW